MLRGKDVAAPHQQDFRSPKAEIGCQWPPYDLQLLHQLTYQRQIPNTRKSLQKTRVRNSWGAFYQATESCPKQAVVPERCLVHSQIVLTRILCRCACVFVCMCACVFVCSCACVFCVFVCLIWLDNLCLLLLLNTAILSCLPLLLTVLVDKLKYFMFWIVLSFIFKLLPLEPLVNKKLVSIFSLF